MLHLLQIKGKTFYQQKIMTHLSVILTLLLWSGTKLTYLWGVPVYIILYALFLLNIMK